MIEFTNCKCKVEKGKFNINNISLDCPAVWQLLAGGHTVGVFQLEKNLGQEWAKRVRPNSIEGLAALISLLRPGPLESSMSQNYVDIKFGRKKSSYLHPSLKPILESTYAQMVYQEQALRIATDIAGFSPESADDLRKCVTKDTLFLSKQRGWISIGTLIKTGYKKDLFLTMNSRGIKKWKRISSIWSNGIKTTRTIESRTGLRINTTKHHQFLTSDGWKARMKLNDKDYLITTKQVDYDGRDLISQEMAIIIAGIIAEGYFTTNSNKTFTMFDAKMMDRFCECFEKEFGEQPKMSPLKGINNRVARILYKYAQKLHKYVGYGLSANKKLPEIMMGMTVRSTQKFLSYLLACDGGITKKSKQFEYSSKSRTLVQQIQLLLLRFGIRSTIIPKNVKNYGIYYSLYIGNFACQQKLLAGLSHEWPDYKKNALKNILSDNRREQFTIDIVPSELVNRMLNQYPFIANYEGGTAWTSNVSRNRFLRMAQKTNDQYWIDIAQNEQFYDKVKSVSTRSVIEVFDFSMEDTTSPYIIANGMIIHNSIGKKDAKLMASLKDKFVTGCQKYSQIGRGIAEEIFGWIEKCQRYSFNKSHALSYGMISYQTSWLKCHFPQEFFTSYLTYSQYKGDPKEEIYRLVQDARLFGVDIFPPDIRRGNIDFQMTKNPQEGIAFGLSHIRGVGASAIQKIIAVSRETPGTGSLKTWADFLSAVPDFHRNVGIALIKSGACDCYNMERSEMVRELEVILGTTVHDTNGKKVEIKGLTSKEKIYFFDQLQQGIMTTKEILLQMAQPPGNKTKTINSMSKTELVQAAIEYLNQVNTAFDGIIDDGSKFIYTSLNEKEAWMNNLKSRTKKVIIELMLQNDYKDIIVKPPCSNDARRRMMIAKAAILEKPLEDSNAIIATAEKYFLGIALSCSPADDADDSLATHTCLEIAKAPNNETIAVCAIIDNVKHTKTKRGKNPGQPMCFLTISDSTYSIDHAVVFPDSFGRLKAFCKTDLICLIYGEKKNGSFIISDIQKLM